MARKISYNLYSSKKLDFEKAGDMKALFLVMDMNAGYGHESQLKSTHFDKKVK